jgi:hypothetical protein
MYLRTIPTLKRDERPDDRGVCTTLLCRAIESWSVDQWDGAARMAEARKDADVALTAIDIEALTRQRGRVAAEAAVAHVDQAQHAKIGKEIKAARAKTKRK